jgi:PST family polysaccharide transporter
LSGVYVGFILQAIGAVFDPRLTAAASDNSECNHLVNEQINVSLLLALPGILATIAAAPLVLRTFYSAQFLAAEVVLQWQAIGVLVRVVSFPLFLIILAKGSKRGFVAMESLSAITNIVLVWAGVKFFGLPGTGIAFLVANVVYLIVVLRVARVFSGFSWSRSNRRIGMIALFSVLATFAACRMFHNGWSAAVGFCVAAIVGVWALSKLLALVPDSRPAKFIERMFASFQPVKTRSGRTG